MLFQIDGRYAQGRHQIVDLKVMLGVKGEVVVAEDELSELD